jgi:ribosomal protein L29
MNMKEIKKKTDVELHTEMQTLSEQLRLFRFDLSGSKIRNVKKGTHLRKDIARIQTELRERQNTTA